MEHYTLAHGLAVWKTFILGLTLFHLVRAVYTIRGNETFELPGWPNSRTLTLNSGIPGLEEIQMDGVYELPIDSPALSAINRLLRNSPSISGNRLQVLSSHYTPLEDMPNSLEYLPSFNLPQNNIINPSNSGYNLGSKDVPPCDSNGLKAVLFYNNSNQNPITQSNRALFVSNPLIGPKNNLFSWPASKEFINNALPPQEPFSLQNFTAMKEQLLNNLYPETKNPVELHKRYSRNIVKRKDNLRQDRRNRRKLRSIPLQAKRFHLMHGIYKENDEMMMKALEKAQNLALSVETDEDEPVIYAEPKHYRNYGLSSIKGQPAKRRISMMRQHKVSKSEPREAEQMNNPNILLELQYEINKKILEIQKIKEAINNVQILQSRFPMSYGPRRIASYAPMRANCDIRNRENCSNESRSNSGLNSPSIIEFPPEQMVPLEPEPSVPPQKGSDNEFPDNNDPPITYFGELFPSYEPNDDPKEAGGILENESFIPGSDPLNPWSPGHESVPYTETREKRFCNRQKIRDYERNI